MFQGLNSGPQACKTNTLPSELICYPRAFVFRAAFPHSTLLGSVLWDCGHHGLDHLYCVILGCGLLGCGVEGLGPEVSGMWFSGPQ